MREKIEDRIEEIENFYELNFDKPNSQYFEKGRMKLKKLLMFEPSNISEMNVEMNNNKVNMALVVNGTNKNTIESNYNNNMNTLNNNSIHNINNDGDISFKIINKPIYKNINENKFKIGKLKFVPLKEKKWKKNSSVEKMKNMTLEKYINNNYNNKKIKDMKNNQIYINKQSNVYINKNYNLYPINNKNNVLNKYINKKNSNEKNKSYIQHNYNISKESNSSKSQENLFNIKEYT